MLPSLWDGCSFWQNSSIAVTLKCKKFNLSEQYFVLGSWDQNKAPKQCLWAGYTLKGLAEHGRGTTLRPPLQLVWRLHTKYFRTMSATHSGALFPVQRGKLQYYRVYRGKITALHIARPTPYKNGHFWKNRVGEGRGRGKEKGFALINSVTMWK